MGFVFKWNFYHYPIPSFVKYYEWEKKLPAQNIPDQCGRNGMINFTLDETDKKAQYID